MPWDNGVDKKAHINGVATTVLEKPMPLTSYDGAAETILWSRQTEFVSLWSSPVCVHKRSFLDLKT